MIHVIKFVVIVNVSIIGECNMRHIICWPDEGGCKLIFALNLYPIVINEYLH